MRSSADVTRLRFGSLGFLHPTGCAPHRTGDRNPGSAGVTTLHPHLRINYRQARRPGITSPRGTLHRAVELV